MRELSVEEKAKRYDEAIEVARKIKNGEPINVSDGTPIPVAIFPELKESEGERIRKIIKDTLQSYNRGVVLGCLNAKDYSDCLAWLEKQGEQKPAEWSEKDEDTLHCIIDALDSLDIRTNTNGEHEDHTEEIYWLKSLKDKVGCEVNCTTTKDWSEEDEKIYQSIMDDTVQENQLDDKQTNWLRDIKYRYFPQPKQERNKDDEIWIDRACMLLDELNHLSTLTLAKIPSNVNDIISHLKSLKPQKHWKPTGAQLASLEIACDRNDRIGFDLTELLKGLKIYGGCSMLPQWKPSDLQMEALDDFIYSKYPNTEKHGAAVKSLYQDLKKLREE